MFSANKTVLIKVNAKCAAQLFASILAHWWFCIPFSSVNDLSKHFVGLEIKLNHITISTLLIMVMKKIGCRIFTVDEKQRTWFRTESCFIASKTSIIIFCATLNTRFGKYRFRLYEATNALRKVVSRLENIRSGMEKGSKALKKVLSFEKRT